MVVLAVEIRFDWGDGLVGLLKAKDCDGSR
jgi:hypothetical protein